jgi:hypothetical protein
LRSTPPQATPGAWWARCRPIGARSVRAIERGDPDAGERAMREHIVYVQDLVTVVRRESERCKH